MTRVALVTGAARGIGRACAERFAADGWRLVLVDRDSAVADLPAALGLPAARGIGVVADVTVPEAVEQAVTTALGRFGRIDVLINNAGILRPGSILDLSVEDFTGTLQVNVVGVFLLSRLVARHMVEARIPGCIINISSVGAVVAVADQLAYAASKGAVRQLTTAMAVALAPHGIRVNAIGPGSIDTGLLAGSGLGSDEARARIEARTPLGRLGAAAEIAGVAAFLAGPDASYVTGQTIYADGGRLALNHTMPGFTLARAPQPVAGP